MSAFDNNGLSRLYAQINRGLYAMRLFAMQPYKAAREVGHFALSSGGVKVHMWPLLYFDNVILFQ